MRAFPRAGGRSALAAAVFVATLGALAVPLAHADERDDLENQQDAVQEQIAQTQADAEEASAAVTAAKSALAAAEADLAAAKGDLAAADDHLASSQENVADIEARLLVAQSEDARMKAALDLARADLVQAKADLAAGRAALDAQHAEVKQSVVGAYQQGPPGLLALTGYLQARDPADLTRKLEYADTVVEVQASTFEALRLAEIALQARREEVRAAERAVADRAAQAAQQLLAVQELKDEADEAANAALLAADAALLAADAVTVTVAARERAQREAERARQEDLAELEKLKKQEERIKQQILEAAERDTSTGFVGVDDGFLLPPVDGAVTSPFGFRIHPIYGYWGLHDGTDFGVGCGESMLASADGTVLSSSYSSIYGNRLYLDVGKVNGHAVTVVYNHATSYRVGVGDTVARGEVVGYVGSTGWSTGCHLHFTVLQDGEPVDPMTYL